MFYNIIWTITTVVLALLQTTWPDFLKPQNVTPDLTLMLVVYFAITEGEERAMLTGALGGIYLDVASKAVLGHNILCLVIVGYAVGRLSTRLVTDHPAVKAGLVLLAGVAQGTLFTGIMYVQDPANVSIVDNIVTVVVPASFFTALITPFVFFGLSRVLRNGNAPQGSAT